MISVLNFLKFPTKSLLWNSTEFSGLIGSVRANYGKSRGNWQAAGLFASVGSGRLEVLLG